jgi:hypothetical protein
MTVTPNAPTKASPRWLRVVTGVLLFPGLWLGAVFAFDSAVPLIRSGALAPVVWLPPTALFAALVAWLAVRRASTRLLAPFAVVVLAAYVGTAMWLGMAPMRSPKSVESGELLNLPPQNEAPRPPQTAELPDLPTRSEPTMPPQTAEIPSPVPAPPPIPAKPVPPPAPGSGRAAEPIPQFPWPPPQTSATYVLPAAVFERGLTIGQVVTTIIAALEKKGYVERSFFTTPADGVVLVTRLERINEDGSSAADAERWPAVGGAGRSSAGLAQFLRGLFYVDPGRYRVIVFVLQDAPFRQSSEQISGQQAREWLRTGANVLPRELMERAYTGDCTVLVYEFASDGTAVRVVDSRLTGRQHLERAGVLATLGRAN